MIDRLTPGQTLIDICEFYKQDGEKKPGKKGLSLTLDQACTSRTCFIMIATSDSCGLQWKHLCTKKTLPQRNGLISQIPNTHLKPD
jgi:hypothetical protein